MRHCSGRKAVPITPTLRAIVEDLVIMRWRYPRLRAQRTAYWYAVSSRLDTIRIAAQQGR